MRKSIISGLVLMSTLVVTSGVTFAEYKEGDSVTLSGNYLASASVECMGGLQTKIYDVLVDSGKFKKLGDTVSQIGCMENMGILTNNLTDNDFKPTEETYSYSYNNIAKYIENLNSGNFDTLTKTNPGDYFLLPGKNLLTNLNKNPTYQAFAKNSIYKNNSEALVLWDFLSKNLSTKSTVNKKEKQQNLKITIKGKYFNPKGVVKDNREQSGNSNFNVDLKIVVVDDIIISGNTKQDNNSKDNKKTVDTTKKDNTDTKSTNTNNTTNKDNKDSDTKTNIKTDTTKVSDTKDANPKDVAKGYSYITNKDVITLKSFTNNINVVTNSSDSQRVEKLLVVLDSLISKSTGNKQGYYKDIRNFVLDEFGLSIELGLIKYKK